MNAPRHSIPLLEAVLCPDCCVVFWSRDVACPGCAATLGIVPLQTDAPAREIARLRDQLAWATAALHQIGYGSHTREFKSRVALKALDYLKNETTPAGTSAAEPRKEQTN